MIKVIKKQYSIKFYIVLGKFVEALNAFKNL